MSIGIALDLGTSGFRAQAVDLDRKEINSNAFTTWHPLPGGNVIDHILFALTFGQSVANNIIVKTINKLLLYLASSKVELLGNSFNSFHLFIRLSGKNAFKTR